MTHSSLKVTHYGCCCCHGKPCRNTFVVCTYELPHQSLCQSDCLINLLALTVLSISHERVRSLEVQRHLRNDVNVLRVTVGIWGCSLIAAIPAFFSAHFVQHVHPDGVLHAACVKVGSRLMSYMRDTYLT